MHATFGKLVLLCLCTRETLAEHFKECKHSADGNFVAIENNCLGYIYCMGENSFTDLCPVGTYFDPQQQQCTDDVSFKCVEYIAENAEGAGQQSASVQQQSTTLASPNYNAASTTPSNIAATTHVTVATIVDTLPSTTVPHRPHCQPAVDEYFPYQLRCEYYYRCSRGYLSILRCSFGYGWDFLLEKCVPFKQAQCYRISEVQAFKF
ncbi:PREDICTED: uncharacterized protein LOC108380223 [Rhagoletis zephyria]|uniref:uncharacterized protein LOC108380223 n=1 Tax=Rhagoletis zephyria TaxID=28612 RepID=UPI0008114597|nr:PREDICTED: uncharacterized protein LOC108380223 [Rhagoletis zephyria]